MLKKIIRIILGIFFSIIGIEMTKIFEVATEFQKPFLEDMNSWLLSTQTLAIILGFLFGFFLVYFLIEKLLQLIISFENKIKEISFSSLVVRVAGAFFGLILGILINLTIPYNMININGSLEATLTILINFIFVYLGFSIFSYKESDIAGILKNSSKKKNSKNKGRSDEPYDGLISNKILDTSVIIDGRIADICKSGFIEGTLIIPEFVLEELRHIADSSDALKRNRGRRGLDILKSMQKDSGIKVEIIDQEFEDIQEVDSKLVKLAQFLDARVVTNDYNLNKVADLQGVFVLNINELANAVKPVVLPGEEMDVKVIKEGKENGQGVAYLDDGTMIVVDDGVNYMGKKISVMVTSILQTAAGRMIFAKPKAREQIV